MVTGAGIPVKELIGQAVEIRDSICFDLPQHSCGEFQP
jgi:hypothetical protein